MPILRKERIWQKADVAPIRVLAQHGIHRELYCAGTADVLFPHRFGTAALEPQVQTPLVLIQLVTSLASFSRLC
jgi:hypothetical protein